VIRGAVVLLINRLEMRHGGRRTSLSLMKGDNEMFSINYPTLSLAYWKYIDGWIRKLVYHVKVGGLM